MLEPAKPIGDLMTPNLCTNARPRCSQRSATAAGAKASSVQSQMQSQARSTNWVAACGLKLKAMVPLAVRVCYRVGLGALFLLLLSMVSFALTHLSSGDAALNTLQPMGVTSSAVIESVRESLGLNAPLVTQYLSWLSMVLLEGNLGWSTHFGRAISEVLLLASVETLKLCVLSISCLLLTSLLLGIYCALHPQSIVDRLLHLGCILFLSLPVFLVSLIALYFLGVRVGLVSTLKPQTWSDFITPALCLSLPLCAYYLRQVRLAVQKEMDAPYLVALKARGIKESTILWHHILPRALIALLPLLGISVGHILCGAVMVETIFSLNGLGAIALQAVTYRDLALIQSYVLYCALIFMLINTAVNAITLRLSRHALSEVPTC